MLPPPPIRGIFRTDQRARAAYAEGAGIFRILPAANDVMPPGEDPVNGSFDLGSRSFTIRLK